ncbi:hypothetical protein CPB86DRAFT_788069 [Serendipita vermifera]|nr:hypothetical protein CPB86DRAFT_788069 [Serendipita vermifera]
MASATTTPTPDAFNFSQFFTPSSTSAAATASNTDEPFMRWDGTCGPNPTLIHGAGPWIGLIAPAILALIFGAATVVARARKSKEDMDSVTCSMICSRSVFFNRTFCDVIGRLTAVGVVAAVVRTSLPETSIRAGLWGAFLGPHQGSIVAMWQLLDRQSTIPAIIQIHAEMPLTFLGLAHIYLGEHGKGPRIAVSAIRNPVLIAGWLFGVSLLVILVLNIICRLISRPEWLKSALVRILFCISGLLSLVAGLMMVVSGTQVCGLALGLSDLLGAVFVAGLNVVFMYCGWS